MHATDAPGASVSSTIRSLSSALRFLRLHAAVTVAALKTSILASRTSFVLKPRMPTHQQQVHTALTGALP
jgi:hypothetical protein